MLRCLLRYAGAALLLLPSLACSSGGGMSVDPCPAPTDCAAEVSYDVLVVGATDAGMAAALQAARMGARVLAVESTDWVGGQLTAAGVGGIDLSGWAAESGVLGEIVHGARAYYQGRGWTLGTCLFSDQSTCIEPKVGRAVLLSLVNETRAAGATLDVWLRRELIGVVRDGSAVRGAFVRDRVTGGVTRVEAAVTIEASGFGELLRLLPGSYELGDASLGGCAQAMTYAPIIRKYTTLPAGLRLSGPVPETALDPYDAIRPEFVARVARDCTTGSCSFGSWPLTYPLGFSFHNAYRGLPDPDHSAAPYTSLEHASITKTGVNMANDLPVASAAELLEPSARQALFCRAKLRALQFLWYVQNELGHVDWSAADDEGFNSAFNRLDNVCPELPESLRDVERNLTVTPYLREGPRLVGVATLTEAQVPRTTVNTVLAFADGIAFAQEMDLHGCPPDTYVSTQPYQVPMGALIARDYSGLLGAGLNISVDRLVNGGTRLHGPASTTGQAAGALAALAVSRGVDVHAVDARSVQTALLTAKNPVQLFPFAVGAEGPLPFSDDPYFLPIQKVALAGIMRGFGPAAGNLFGRETLLPRRVLAVVIERMLSQAGVLPAVGDCAASGPAFSDVPCADPQWAAIEALRLAGITAGCAVGLFCPETNTSREQAALFFARTWQRLDPSVTLAHPSVATFTDLPTSSAGFDAVETFLSRGLDLAYLRCAPGPQYCPASEATRAFVTPLIVSAMSL